ncbi:restriction endonuclease [Acinetobacter sp. V91_7]|uniref:restriction endonuclease n=1 Tax=unclassified Acinetobacter TaxID=196816 RepID=UPI00287D1CC2|nr:MULTISPECIES: restriction endonuclease [unclassified Acinetobacter]MDS7932152.1 restriction endonuclease [Acinetobacter sp. V91_4B]MDS7961550.1 restriction endonuclease [Acinetobacter sp. V91_7]MDS8028000.1 restriction endonuclease [Acinetobacter sp. V91_13]
MTTGATFESYIHYVYQTLLNLKGEQIQVSRNTTFCLPSGESYEVDIYYEFTRVGVKHRVAIECKNWKKPVDQGRILEFHQKIKNIGENIVGVIISSSGLQSGAKLVADRHGIIVLNGTDVPTIPQLLANHIKTKLIPEAHCIGEPFWFIGELDKDSTEGTGTYYAFPENSPVKIPLFFSKKHAEIYHTQLPDKENFAVFGMPQYKLNGLLAFAIPQKVKFGLVRTIYDDGKVALEPISATNLKDEYLL